MAENWSEQGVFLKTMAVRRTARVAIAGGGPGMSELWIVCHGYGQLAARFITRFAGIATPERRVIAPEALSRFYVEKGAGFHGQSSQVGASWMTSEWREDEIADYIAYLDAVYDDACAANPRDSFALRVLGFSQGTSTVARWLAAGHAKADQLILWAGSIPLELTPEGAARIKGIGRPILLVVGDEDQFITSKVLESQLSALRELGLDVELKRFSGGHDIDQKTLASIAEDLSRGWHKH